MLRRQVAVWLGFFACFFVAFHLVTTLHEVVGHGLLAWCFGADVRELYVSWMGASGYVRWQGELHGPARTFVAWGGIVSTGLLGAVLGLFHSRVRRQCQPWTEALHWCAWVCLTASSFGYTILGLHSGYGDPATTSAWLAKHGLLGGALAGFVLAHLLVVRSQARALTGLWSGYWRCRRPAMGVARIVACIGSAVVVLALLNGVESRSTQEGQTVAEISRPRWLATVDAELEAFRQRRGLSDSPDHRALMARRRAELLDIHRPWPLPRYLYYPGLILVVGVGLWRGVESSPNKGPKSAPPLTALPIYLVVLSLLTSGLLYLW